MGLSQALRCFLAAPALRFPIGVVISLALLLSCPSFALPPWGCHKPCVASQLPQLCASHLGLSQALRCFSAAPAVRFPLGVVISLALSLPCNQAHLPQQGSLNQAAQLGCPSSAVPAQLSQPSCVAFAMHSFSCPSFALRRIQLPQLRVPPWVYHKPGFKLFSHA